MEGGALAFRDWELSLDDGGKELEYSGKKTYIDSLAYGASEILNYSVK